MRGEETIKVLRKFKFSRPNIDTGEVDHVLLP